MGNENDVIDIVEDNIGDVVNIDNTVQVNDNIIQNVQQSINSEVVNNFESIDNQNIDTQINYDPVSKPEEITVKEESDDNQSKSGLGFILVLFVIIGAFIVALPYIVKFLK